MRHIYTKEYYMLIKIYNKIMYNHLDSLHKQNVDKNTKCNKNKNTI